MTIQPFEALAEPEWTAVVEEGARLLTFAASDTATHDVQLFPPS